MCGRYFLKILNLELFAEYGISEFDVVETEGFDFHGPRYNVGPMTPVPIVRPDAELGKLELTSLKWGLVPYWCDDPKYGARCINARADGIDTKPSFKAAFRKRRCVVPATGFYEWRVMPDGKTKQPYALTFKSGAPMFFAGLWERTTRTPAQLETVTICTVALNPLMAKVHDRTPAILNPRSMRAWLDPSIDDPQKLLPLLASYEADAMQAYPVSTFVGKVGNEGPQCIEPLADPSGDLAL